MIEYSDIIFKSISTLKYGELLFSLKCNEIRKNDCSFNEMQTIMIYFLENRYIPIILLPFNNFFANSATQINSKCLKIC